MIHTQFWLLWGINNSCLYSFQMFSGRASIAFHGGPSSSFTHRASYFLCGFPFCLSPRANNLWPTSFPKSASLIKIDSCCYHSVTFSGNAISSVHWLTWTSLFNCSPTGCQTNIRKRSLLQKQYLYQHYLIMYVLIEKWPTFLLPISATNNQIPSLLECRLLCTQVVKTI